MIADPVLAAALLHHVGFVLHTHSSGHGGGVLLLLASGPAASAGLFWVVFNRYRNTDKSHDFEHETAIAPTGPITGSDTKVDTVRRVTNEQIAGHNSHDYRTRVQRY